MKSRIRTIGDIFAGQLERSMNMMIHTMTSNLFGRPKNKRKKWYKGRCVYTKEK